MVVQRIYKKDCRVPRVSDDLTFPEEMPNDGLKEMNCRQMPPGADAASADASRQMPPPRAPGGVSRAPVLQSFVATMSDVLPPSSLGSRRCRCPPSNSFVPRSLFTDALFRLPDVQSPPRCGVDWARSATCPVQKTRGVAYGRMYFWCRP